MASKIFFRYLVDAYKMFFWTLCVLGIAGLLIAAALWVSQGIVEIFGWPTTARSIIYFGMLALTAPVLMAFAMKALEKKLCKAENIPE